MTTLKEILIHYGMPKYNVDAAIQQIAETYGANRYLDGVIDGADAVNELAEKKGDNNE